MVPHDWLTRMLDEAESGAHLVLGKRFSRCLAWRVTQSKCGLAAIGSVPTIRTCTEPTLASAPTPMSQLAGGGGLATGEDVALAGSAASIDRLKIVKKGRHASEHKRSYAGTRSRRLLEDLRGIDLSHA